MLIIQSEVQDCGDEDEKNYETDEINKENMNELYILIVEQKLENTKHTTKHEK